MDHIVGLIADQTTRTELDSTYEDQLLMNWLESNAPSNSRLTVAYNGRYPAKTKIDQTVTVIKELPLGQNRVDAVVIWGMKQYQLVEVKSESKLDAGLIGELLAEHRYFIDQFSKTRGPYKVNPERVSVAVLTDGPATGFRETVEATRHDRDIDIEVYSMS